MKPDFSNFSNDFTDGNIVLELFEENKRHEEYLKRQQNTPKGIRKFVKSHAIKKKRWSPSMAISRVFNQLKIVNTPLLKMEDCYTELVNGEEGGLTFTIPYKD